MLVGIIAFTGLVCIPSEAQAYESSDVAQTLEATLPAEVTETIKRETNKNEQIENRVQAVPEENFPEDLPEDFVVEAEEQEYKEELVQTKIDEKNTEDDPYVPVIAESEHMRKEREAAEQKAREEEQKRKEEQERIEKALSEPATAETSIVGVPDPNPERIDQYLGGELAGKGQVFVDAGTMYNIDPMFLAAVAMHETGNGTSDAVISKNNVGGIMTVNEDGSTSLRTFDSVDESIYALAELISKYVSKGLDTIAEIQPVYCPVGAENDPNGVNHHWIDGVLYFWNEMRSV